MIPLKFNQIIRALREQNNLTAREIASKIGVSTSAYLNYERGERQPNFDTLCAISDYYKVSADYLLGRTEIKEPAFIDILTALGIDDSYRLSPEEFGEAFDALEQPVKVIIYKVMTEMVNKLQSIRQDQATATVEDIPEPLKPFA